MSKITEEKLNEYSDNFNSSKANLIAANSAAQNGIINAAVNYQAKRKIADTFTISLKQGSITNQKASGRCWLFSALNTFRFEFMQKYNVEDFELSQNYLFFYDKLEKVNYYLESMLQITDEPVDGRLYSWINSMPLNDGGQWDMFVNLVNKYGVCPKEAYPDSANASASRDFVSYLTSKIREFAVVLRKEKLAGASMERLQSIKEDMLNDVYRVLVISLGEPPKSFDWNIKNKDGKLIQEFGITPKEFFNKYINIDLNDYVSIINAPTEDKPFNKLYTVKFLGNVVEGNIIKYLNLPMDVIKKAVIKQLKDGHPVWFGSDVAKYGERKEGIWDQDTVDIESLFDFKYTFTKADKLTYGDSAMNHAMVIQGVNLDKDGNPDRWRIENSWGKDSGRNGYYTMSAKWFDEYVYQVVVNKKYLDKNTLKLLKGDITELEPWDPMGTLAD